MGNDLKKYREGLIETQRHLSESFDKLLITLSGGALALSITFLKDIIKIENIISPSLLMWAWGLFIISLASILGEILFGIEAHKKAIEQIDAGTIYKEKVGGVFSFLTGFLHIFAALALLIGLVFISVFAYLNLGVDHDKRKSETTSKTYATPNSSSQPKSDKERLAGETRGLATTPTTQETR